MRASGEEPPGRDSGRACGEGAERGGGPAAQPPPPPHRVPHCPSAPIPTPAAGPRSRFWDMACLTRPETRSVWARLWPEVFRGSPSSGVGLALAHDVRTRGHRTGQPGGPVARRVTGRSRTASETARRAAMSRVRSPRVALGGPAPPRPLPVRLWTRQNRAAGGEQGIL